MNIRLSNVYQYFVQPKHLERLNYALRLHDTLTPNTLITSTGCNFSQALDILVFLFEMNFADGFLYIYLKNDPVAPIASRSLAEKKPLFPIFYSDGEQRIDNSEDVLFGLAFNLISTEKVQFYLPSFQEQ